MLTGGMTSKKPLDREYGLPKFTLPQERAGRRVVVEGSGLGISPLGSQNPVRTESLLSRRSLARDNVQN